MEFKVTLHVSQHKDKNCKLIYGHFFSRIKYLKYLIKLYQGKILPGVNHLFAVIKNNFNIDSETHRLYLMKFTTQ